MIGCVEVAFEGWSTPSAIRRALLILLLCLVILLIATRPEVLLRRYGTSFGALVGIVYICSVSATHLFRSDDATAVVNPTALLGLWIIYGFVRLPLQVAISIGIAGGCFALFGSRMTNLPDPTTRTFVYLLIGNALGVTLARSIESRERQLFLQKQTLQEAQVELQRRGHAAEQASAAKTRLIAAVGHDLRQPMMAARLHLSVLLQRIQAGDSIGAGRQADKVQQSVQLLSDMLEHLLLSARYDAGTETSSIKSLSLLEMFQRLSHVCEPQAQEQGASLIIRMPRPEVRVTTDSRIFLRVLVNLVTNALKFAKYPEDGAVPRVVVRSALVGARCRIAVLDNGIGIADQDLEAIWEPFFQVGNEERNRAQGIGLGLYLVKQSLGVLEGHRVSARSTLGSGTCFVLELPGLADAELLGSSPNGCDKDVRLGLALRGMHVLLIEDDQAAREALEAQLEAWGVSFLSGAEVGAVLPECLASGRVIDMILADLRLPGKLDGIATIRHIRDRLGYVANAVLITAEVDSGDVMARLPELCVLLQKPFDSTLLYELLAAPRDGICSE